MNEFSDINADTHRNSEDFITALGEYNIIKVLINGDFLAKNEYDDYFLLSKSNGEVREQIVPDLIQSNVIQPIQLIQQNGEHYKVFPFERRMQWGGQLNSKGKSEKYCATLLYSALRHIIKPLSAVKVPIKYEKWINLENLWIKDNAIFMLLRQKYSPDKNNSIEKNSNIRRFYRINSSKFQDSMRLLIKKIGQLFWNIFFKTQQDRQSLGKQKFKAIIVAMRKNEINIEQLEQIMIERKAVNALMSSHKKSIGLAQRRVLYDTLQINNRQEDKNDNSKQKQFVIPVYKGTPVNGLLFAKNRRYQVETLPNNTFQNEKRKKITILSSIDSDVPPSFSKNRRFKKMSIFGDSRSKSRGLSFSVKGNNDSITRKQLNCFKKQRYSISNKNDISDNYSFAAENNKDQAQQSPSQLKIKNSSKKKQAIKYLIDSSFKKQILFPSKIDRFNQKSKQKALKMLHSTLQVDNSSINDSKFISALREKKNQPVKQAPTTFFKSKYENQKIQNKIYRALHEKQFNYHRISLNDDNQQTHLKENKEKKIINEDLYHQKFQENISNKSLKQEELFTEKSEYEQQKNIKLNIPQAKYQVERKHDIGINYHSNKVIKTSIQKNEVKNTYNLPIRQPLEDKIQRIQKVQELFQRQNTKIIRQQEKSKDPQINRQMSFQVELPIIKGTQMVSSLIPKKIDTPSVNNIDQKIKPSKQSFKQPIIQEIKKQQTKIVGLELTQQKKEQFFNKVEKNSFSAIPEADQEYVYVSKINAPKKQQKIDKNQSQIITKPIQKKQKPKIRQAFSSLTEINDQIQQVSLGFKNTKKTQQPPKSIPPLPLPNKNSAEQAKKQLEKQDNTTIVKNNTQSKKQISKTQLQEDPPSRMKTAQSNASSNGQKTAKKHIDEYIFIVNKMGEAVAKTAKLSKKLQSIEWYTGVYFLYKRFYHQRKKIQRYLQESIPKLTRYGEIPQQQWRQWLMKGQREALLAKCKADNVNIENSIKKMGKKVESKQLPAKVLMNVNVNKNNIESTKIAIQYVIDQYDQAVQNKLLKDPQILIHLCQMINSLYVIAQLDGKIKQKKKIADFMKINRTQDELNILVQTMFDLYEQQQ